MIADIFYPIFTITITNLVCFIRKKKTKFFGGFAPTPSPRHHPGPPGDLQLQPFLTLTKTNGPIFFLYYPLISQIKYSKQPS